MRTFKCGCHGCAERVTEDAPDLRCDFCFVHCPHPLPYMREFEPAFFGLWCWRIHMDKASLEADGFDAREAYGQLRAPPAPPTITVHTTAGRIVRGPLLGGGVAAGWLELDGPHDLFGRVHLPMCDVEHARGDDGVALDAECRGLDRALWRALQTGADDDEEIDAGLER